MKCRAAVSIYNHLHYLKNCDSAKKRSALWREQNPDKAKLHDLGRKDYFTKPYVKLRMAERSKKWAEDNRDKVLAASERYRRNNKALYAHYAMKRAAGKLQATPRWLTEEHWRQIRAVYEEAARLTKETGVRHEVDHIVPLRGKTVCGLHVPWNLRAIPMIQNRCRPRTWRGADDPGLIGRAV